MNEVDVSFLERKGGSNLSILMMEEKEPPKKTYHNMCRLVTTIILLCISTFVFGNILTDIATFTEPVRVQFYGSDAKKLSIWGLVIGIFQVGGIFGSAITPQLMRFATRKQLVVSVNLLVISLYGVVQVPNMWVLLAIRVLQGAASGSLLSMIPLYINEICPKQIVGVLGIFTQLSMIFACAVNYAVALILTKVGVDAQVFCRIMLSYGGVLNVILVFLLLVGFIPESPKSLIKKNRNQEAKEAIALFIIPDLVEEIYQQKLKEVLAESKRLREEAEAEERAQREGANQTERRVSQMKDMKAKEGGEGEKKEEEEEKEDEEEEEGEKGEDLVLKKNDTIVYSKKAILLGFQLPFMMQLAGIGAVLTQSNTIISHVLPQLSLYAGLVVTLVQTTFNVFTMPLLLKFGRKQVILIGNLLLAIIDIAIGIALVFSDKREAGIATFVLMILYVMVFGLTMAPIRLYVPEIMPAKKVPLATMFNWVGASIVTIFTPMIIEANDNNAFPAFFIFGGVIIVCYIYNLLVMVETRGRTTKEIADLIGNKLS